MRPRYKIDTANGKATLLDRRRVMAKNLDIADAERIVRALNAREETTKRRARMKELLAQMVAEDNELYRMRLVPRYEPESPLCPKN